MSKHEHRIGVGLDMPTSQVFIMPSYADSNSGIDIHLVNEATGESEDMVCTEPCCAIALRDWLIERYGMPATS